MSIESIHGQQGAPMARPAAPTPVRFAHRTDDGPVLAVPSRTPRLSWHIPDAPAGLAADAYALEVTGEDEQPDRFLVESAEQVLVPWPAAPLASRQRVAVRVRVRDTGGDWTDWSPTARAEGGLFEAGDWTARFISPRAKAGTP